SHDLAAILAQGGQAARRGALTWRCSYLGPDRDNHAADALREQGHCARSRHRRRPSYAAEQPETKQVATSTHGARLGARTRATLTAKVQWLRSERLVEAVHGRGHRSPPATARPDGWTVAARRRAAWEVTAMRAAPCAAIVTLTPALAVAAFGTRLAPAEKRYTLTPVNASGRRQLATCAI